jgi:hypothetical protein
MMICLAALKSIATRKAQAAVDDATLADRLRVEETRPLSIVPDADSESNSTVKH